MLRRAFFALMVSVFPTLSHAGPKEDAEAVFGRFLASFTAADVEGVLGVFWPDALFWGTGMTELATAPEPVREYFRGMANRRPGEREATWVGGSALVLSDQVVLISGMWQVATNVEGTVRRTPLRVSVAVTKRGATWRIAQFHNSARPAQ